MYSSIGSFSVSIEYIWYIWYFFVNWFIAALHFCHYLLFPFLDLILFWYLFTSISSCWPWYCIQKWLQQEAFHGWIFHTISKWWYWYCTKVKDQIQFYSCKIWMKYIKIYEQIKVRWTESNIFYCVLVFYETLIAWLLALLYSWNIYLGLTIGSSFPLILGLISSWNIASSVNNWSSRLLHITKDHDSFDS